MATAVEEQLFRLRTKVDMRKLVIIGASGHGKVVADIAVCCGYEDIVFLDDAEGVVESAGFPVVGKVADACHYADADFVVAIGNAAIHERIQQQLGGSVVTLVHPGAVISRRAAIGRGCVVMAGAVINPDAVIGDGCIINTAASVDHDCVVGSFAHVSVGAHVAGTAVSKPSSATACRRSCTTRVAARRAARKWRWLRDNVGGPRREALIQPGFSLGSACNSPQC